MALNIAVVLPAKHFGFPVSAHPARHLHLHLRRGEHHAAVARAGARRGLQGAPGLGCAARARLVRQRRHGGAADLAGRRPAGLARDAAAGSVRRAWRSACIAGGAAYFAALFLAGTRLRAHAQRGRGIIAMEFVRGLQGLEAEASRRRHHGRQLRRHPPGARRADREHLRDREAARATRDDADVRAAAARVPVAAGRIRRHGSRIFASAGACSSARTCTTSACCASTRSCGS